MHDVLRLGSLVRSYPGGSHRQQDTDQKVGKSHLLENIDL